MFDKIKDIKNSMKALKDLQTQFGDVDMSNPEAMLKSMGVDMNNLNQHFESQFTSSVELKFINESENVNPEYAYKSDSGFDLRASEDVWVFPNSRSLVPTGLKFNIPDGYEIQVRSKSGLALNQGLFVLNSPGTVDADYRGEIGVILVNLSNEDFIIENGERIAQLIIAKHERAEWIEVTELSETSRGEGGFGSTGVK